MLACTSIDAFWWYWTKPWPPKRDSYYNLSVGNSTVLMLKTSRNWHYWKLATWTTVFPLFASPGHLDSSFQHDEERLHLNEYKFARGNNAKTVEEVELVFISKSSLRDVR